MKKLTALLLIMAMSISLLAACGGGGSDTSGTEAGTATGTGAETEATEVEVNLMEPADAFAGGDGTEENPYQISNAAELYRFSYVMDSSNFDMDDEEYAVVFRDKYYVLTSDITINDVSDFDNWGTTAPEYNWNPISIFSGHLNGNGHTITGFYCNVPTSESLKDAGLFEELLLGASVENLNMDKAMVVNLVGGTSNAIIVGSAQDAEIRNCKASGVVQSASMYAGGIVGSGTWTVIDNCTFAGSVTGESDAVGGIIGSASGCPITNCVNEAMVTSSEYTAGGIAGTLAASSLGFLLDEETYPEEAAATEAWIQKLLKAGIVVKNCTNKGTVCSNASTAGGIVGDYIDALATEYSGKVVMDGCINEGDVTSKSDNGIFSSAAGICAWFSNEVSTKGEEPTIASLEMVNCENKGKITANAGHIGGILGYANLEAGAVTIDACSNTGSLTQTIVDGTSGNFGGIAGSVQFVGDAAVTFKNITHKATYNAVEGRNTGGIVGSLTAAKGITAVTFKNCKSLVDFNVEDDLAFYGGLCGFFLQGGLAEDGTLQKDYAGTYDITGCSCLEGVPPVGKECTFYDAVRKAVEYIEAEIEAIEEAEAAAAE